MFNKIVEDIYGVFADVEWSATQIAAYPRNFQGSISTKPYVLISIIPGVTSPQDFAHSKEIPGLMILSIFVDNTKGEKELFAVASTINSLFERKKLTNGTQMELGSLKPIGIDADNPSLYRGDYSINFTLFGA